MNNYDLLISRLDAFIRKYYANQLLRGALILSTCVIAYILIATIGEYYFYLPAWLKVGIVSAFVLCGISALVWFIILPLLHMRKLGNVISHEQAASIIGTHFPEVSDKLLNILQLNRQHDSYTSRDLIAASIDQKAAQISVVPFTGAVDLSKNKKYLPYLLPVLLAGVFLLVAAPNVFKDGTERLLQPTRTFEKPVPFRFVVKNTSLQAVRNADFTLQVMMEGDALPAEVYVALGDDRLPMQSTGKHTYQYTFRNVTDAVHFRLYAAGFYSNPYTIAVAQKPVLKAFNVKLNYPDYTGRKDEQRNSLGDMTLPEGTVVSWAFVAEHTDEATIKFGDGQPIQLPKQVNIFGSQFRFMNDTGYTLALKNHKTAIVDSYKYTVKVVPDQYPVIQLQEFRDTVSGKQILLSGTAGDDYSVTKVLFHYQLTNAQNQVLSSKAVPLQVSQGSLTAFQHYFDISVFNLQPGQKVNYYIEAWDNDGVHGSKATRSEVMAYHMYNPEQLDSAIQENANQINSGLSSSSDQTEKLQNEYKDLQSKLLSNTDMGWEQKQNMQDLAKMQDNLKNQLENVKKRLDEQVQQSSQKQYSEDLKDKQQELQKQMDNLLDNELKEQMKKLQELMQKLNKENAFEVMKQLEQENKLFNMDLQRMQELMKQLEMQMRMEDLANKMEDLANKQNNLKDQTDKNKKSGEQLSKEQEGLKKELDEAMNKDVKEMVKMNEGMDKKQDMQDMAKQGNDAQQNMQDSKQQLDKGQSKQSSQSQSKAAQNLQSMAQSLRQAANGMDIQMIQKDIRTVRQILTNLVRLSFDQEQLMNKAKVTPVTTQGHVVNQQEQKRLHGNSRMIRDSLFELSKKSAKLSAQVNKETTQLERNMSAATENLGNRRISDALISQQYAMTHTNNLALMLNEMLSNLMQAQSQAQSQNKGQCNNPGGMTPKQGSGKQMSDIITKQKELGNAMQQMQNAKQQRDGENKGSEQGKEQKPGQSNKTQGEGEYGDAEQLARMAQQQAAIRRQLQELNSLLNSKGVGNAKELKEIQERMDKVETDLVNKRMTNEMVLRQREILTRLLEAEKSIREQEQDNKRASKNPENISRPVPPELQKYMNERKQLLEQYKTVPAQLKPYYKNMVQHYYQMIGSGK